MSKKIYITLFIISIIMLSIGGTFAFLTASATAINITQIKSGNLTMTIDGGGSENVSLMPAKCTSQYVIKKKIIASATNNSGGKVSFSIGINIVRLDNDLKRDTVRYILSTSSDSCSVGIIAGGTFKDKTVGEDVWLIKNDYDNITRSGNTYTKTYYLYIWLDEVETQNLSGSISVNMKGTSSNNPNLPTADDYDDGNGTDTLFYKIKTSTDKITRIDFSQVSSSSGTNSIYATTNTNNGVPVYYYRGNVDNHVIFANFCWRIVRTTETGGVKLIYDGVPTNGQCSNTGNATSIGKSKFNENANSPAAVGYMHGTVYKYSSKTMSSASGSIVFGNNITYDASTNTYTLINTHTLTNPSNWSTKYTTISKYHYTCFNSNNTCTKVYYVYYTNNSSANYFELSDGKNHLDILREMLDNSTNINNSTVKDTIDTWYENNMTNYTSKLEDIIFCNDRYYEVSNTAWDIDYGNNGNYLYFGGRQRLVSNRQPSLICLNDNDKFTVSNSNGNGALTYPVGLITVDEITYAGGVYGTNNTSYYLHNGVVNWTMSSYVYYSTYAGEFYLGSSGNFNYGTVADSRVIRPLISLKKGTVLSGGAGTATDPFIVG